MIFVVLLYAILASTFTLAKELVEIIPPVFAISLRMLIAGVILLGVWGYSKNKKNISLQNCKDCVIFGLTVICHILIPYITEFVALQNISPSSACLMYNLSPFISALFSYLFFNEYMTIKKWIGFAIGFSGVIFYLHGALVFHQDLLFSYLLMLISVITSSLGWIFVRILVRHKGYSPMLVNGFAMLMAGAIALPLSYYWEGLIDVSTVNWSYAFVLIAGLIFIANFLFYNLYGHLLKKYTATFLSFVGFTTPLFAALFEWVFLGSSISLNFVYSVLIIGIGIALFYQEELKQGYIQH